MSRLATIRAYQQVGDPGFFSLLGKAAKGVGRFLPGASTAIAAAETVGALAKSRFRKGGIAALPQAASAASGTLTRLLPKLGPLAKGAAGAVATGGLFAAGSAAAERLFGGKAAEAGMVPRRRRRGISATELRGFKRVTSLLYRLGMVPKRSRGRKAVCR